MILEKIVSDYAQKAEGLTITDIRIGLEYVAVELSNGNIGVSYLFKEDAGGPHNRKLSRNGYLGQSAVDAIGWSLDVKDILISSVGIATLNALTASDRQPAKIDEKDGVEYMDIGESDVVGMIGNFKPMVPALKARCKELRIFERRRTEDPEIYPDWAAYSLLPSCDIVIISGTTNINKTQDTVLNYCTGAREVAILGPSTIMYPDAYAGTPVTILAGSYADTRLKSEIFSVVSQGGGGFQLLKYLRKYAIRLK